MPKKKEIDSSVSVTNPEAIRDEFKKLGIYQLRMYARQVGVKLATTLKKAELIDAIMRVLDGDEKPYFKETKKGRPPKDFLQFGGVLGSAITTIGNLVTSPNDYGLPNIVNYEFKIDKNDDSPKKSFEGLIDIFPTGAGVIVPIDGSVDYVVISDVIVRKYDLCRGDLICGKAFEMRSDNIFVAYEIYKINGIEVGGKIDRVRKLEPALNDEYIEFDNSTNLNKIFNTLNVKIKKGDKVLVAGNDSRVLQASIFDLINIASTNKENDIIVLGVNFTQDFRDACKSLSDKIMCIGANFGSEPKDQLRLLELGMQYVRELKGIKGNNIICFIPNIDAVMRLCDENVMQRWISNIEQFYEFAFASTISSLTCVYGMSIDYQDILYCDLQTSQNVYFETCNLLEAKRLRLKYYWATAYRNNLLNFMINDENSYDYMLSNYLGVGNPVEKQVQLEKWVTMGLGKEEIKQKMQEYLNNLL